MTSGSGDVGESDIEEVNRVRRGGNYGWRCFEGTDDISAKSAFGRGLRRSEESAATDR